MNAVTLYRPQAISQDDFRKLDALAADAMDFHERLVEETYWDVDEYGDRVEKRRTVSAGIEIATRNDVSPQLLQSLNRLTTPRYTAVHITRLSAHKPWGRGEASFAVIVEDLARDLRTVSEWAIVKACEYFRRDDTIKFFPDTAVFMRRVIEIDRALKGIGDDKSKSSWAAVEEQQQPLQKRTPQRKRRVNRMCALALKPRANWTRWENKFYAAITRGDDHAAT